MEPISILAVSVALGSIFAAAGVHRVPEGHTAVYYRGGALLDRLEGPGFHYRVPFVTQTEAVQTTVQTDNVMHIPCGTASGTLIEFERIEVVNQLAPEAVHAIVRNFTTSYDKTWIYDKIHHEINQICSRSTLEEVYITKFDTLDEHLRDALQRDIDKHAPGISILAIRVTKPKIPASIRENYERIESERTKLQVAVETQKLVEKQAETERKAALIEAEKLAAVEAVQLERQLRQKENEQALETIANEIHAAKAKADADADYYRMTRAAEADKVYLSKERLQLEAIQAVANNTKIFWGDKLPSLVHTGMLMSSDLT